MYSGGCGEKRELIVRGRKTAVWGEKEKVHGAGDQKGTLKTVLREMGGSKDDGWVSSLLGAMMSDFRFWKESKDKDCSFPSLPVFPLFFTSFTFAPSSLSRFNFLICP